MPSPTSSPIHESLHFPANFLLRITTLFYGLTAFTCIAVRAVYEGYISKRPSRRFWQDVKEARKQLWDLSTPVPGAPGFRHEFANLRTGVRLHYLTNRPAASFSNDGDSKKHKPATAPQNNLIIFIHGFPDTSYIWLPILSLLDQNLHNPSTTTSTTLIAVDLPGFGGSDGVARYGPEEVLGNVSAFFVEMREKYLREGGKVVCVGHDWGATVAYRLAAHAPEIADHFVVMNSALPQLALHNIKHLCTTSYQSLTRFLHHPFQPHHLSTALSSLSPVITQLLKSAYIFIFNLPFPLARISGTTCNLWSLRFINDMTDPRKRWKDVTGVLGTPAGRLAATLGPSLEVCGTGGYSRSVTARAQAWGGMFPEAIRVYREKLATQPWILSPETRHMLANLPSSKYNATSNEAPAKEIDGALKAPTTVIWGNEDQALDARIMVDGIDQYMGTGSQVVVLESVGHWVPAEEAGGKAVVKVVEAVLEGRLQKGGLEGKLEEALGLGEGRWRVAVSK